MVGAPPPTSLHGHLPPLVNLISSLFHCLGSFVPLQSPSLCSQAHALFYKLSKEFFNRLIRFLDSRSTSRIGWHLLMVSTTHESRTRSYFVPIFCFASL